MPTQENADSVAAGDYRRSMAETYRSAARLIDSATNLAYAAQLRHGDDAADLFGQAEDFGSTMSAMLHDQAREVGSDVD